MCAFTEVVMGRGQTDRVFILMREGYEYRTGYAYHMHAMDYLWIKGAAPPKWVEGTADTVLSCCCENTLVFRVGDGESWQLPTSGNKQVVASELAGLTHLQGMCMCGHMEFDISKQGGVDQWDVLMRQGVDAWYITVDNPFNNAAWLGL